MVLKGTPHLICTQIFKIRKVEGVACFQHNVRHQPQRIRVKRNGNAVFSAVIMRAFI